MLLELLRAQRRELTLARNLMCYESELFLATGAADKLISSWVGIGLRWGIPKVFRSTVERDPSIYEEWSHLSFGMRFLAASMGCRSADRIAARLRPARAHPGPEMRCPFTGELLVAVPGLVPDVALIHVHTVDAARQRADRGARLHGRRVRPRRQDGHSSPPRRSCPTRRSSAGRTPDADPGFVVDAVVEVPFGSYPHECHGRYEADFAHFDAYTEQVIADGEAGVHAYLGSWVEQAGRLRRAPGQGRRSTLLEQRRRALDLVAA